MNKYEIALVVSSKIDDEAREAVLEKVKKLIAKYGATFTDVDDQGKKRLAYEIQKMNEGYYYFIHFDAEAGVPAQIEENIRIMDNVLRFLCVRADEA